MKTNELTGAALDWAVAKCEGYRLDLVPEGSYTPSTNWAQGGPIIERERIAVEFLKWDDIDSATAIWASCKFGNVFEEFGTTPLTAAMRCYVTSKLGDDVDVPEELK